MDKSITISDIASELNISKTTVSRAISGKGRIGVETRQRVMDYIEQHDYHPSVLARGLAKNKTYNIGVLLPSDANVIATPFFQTCLMGVCEVAILKDYDVIVTTAAERDISYLERVVQNSKADGFILTRTLVNDKAIAFLKEKRIPFVVIGSVDDKGVAQVDSNHMTACKELTSILLKSGNRAVALMGGNPSHVVDKSRYLGYRSAFEATGIPIREDLIYMNMNSQVVIDQVLERMMCGHVDCIICSDDVICSRVLAKLHREHIHIPKDIRVASLHNNAILETYDPPVTAINIDVRQLGIEACNKIIKMIEGVEITPRTEIHYEIVIRNSTM